MYESQREFLKDTIRLKVDFSQVDQHRGVTAPPIEKPFMEWRYGAAAHKVIAVDAGHVCQNLYLACEAIGAGTCAVGAYHQQRMDRLLRLDGQEEFVVYLAPVGKAPGVSGSL
jgi:nitroreductase